MQYLDDTYTKKLSVVYLLFKFNWVSYILSGNPILKFLIDFEVLAMC